MESSTGTLHPTSSTVYCDSLIDLDRKDIVQSVVGNPICLRPGVYCTAPSNQGLEDVGQLRLVTTDGGVQVLYQDLIQQHVGQEWVSATREEERQEHQEQVLEKPSPSKCLRFQCQKCKYKTDRKSNFDSHIRLIHLRVRYLILLNHNN